MEDLENIVVRDKGVYSMEEVANPSWLGGEEGFKQLGGG
jgi:hypothetical protein